MEFVRKNWFYIGIVVVVLVVGVAFFNYEAVPAKMPQSTLVPTTTPDIPKSMTKPTMQLDLTKNYSAVLHTAEGDIAIEFDTKNTPITSNNFIYLAKNGFYSDTIFHRVIPGFMIQGGDPQGTGMGDPGYKFEDEYLKGKYTRGTVAMANSGPNTNGSQFFIMHKDYDLPNLYVIFGKVTEGIEIVDKIATAPAKPGGEGSSPVNPIKIASIDITEK